MNTTATVAARIDAGRNCLATFNSAEPNAVYATNKQMVVVTDAGNGQFTWTGYSRVHGTRAFSWDDQNGCPAALTGNWEADAEPLVGSADEVVATAREFLAFT